MLRELGLKGRYNIGNVGKSASLHVSMLAIFESILPMLFLPFNWFKESKHTHRSSWGNITNAVPSLLTSSHRRPYKHKFLVGTADRRVSKCAFRYLCVLAGSLVNTSPVACWRIYTQVIPWGHGSVAPDKSHCQQWTSSLFGGFLPNPFIQDLFLWRTSQEFVKPDLYPLSLISLSLRLSDRPCRYYY